MAIVLATAASVGCVRFEPAGIPGTALIGSRVHEYIVNAFNCDLASEAGCAGAPGDIAVRLVGMGERFGYAVTINRSGRVDFAATHDHRCPGVMVRHIEPGHVIRLVARLDRSAVGAKTSAWLGASDTDWVRLWYFAQGRYWHTQFVPDEDSDWFIDAESWVHEVAATTYPARRSGSGSKRLNECAGQPLPALHR